MEEQKQVITSVQFKRGSKEALTNILKGEDKPLRGEPIFESDTFSLKVGDGVRDYGDLPYISGGGGSNQIEFYDTFEDFPTTGIDTKIYIARQEANSYIWVQNEYRVVSVDGRRINGGSATDWND